ncbi:MAG: hypothetical protein ACUZ8H_01600 [Candidatus Anammoxibacter sp.]
MKIIIFTYDRYHRITTSKYWKDIPHTVLCHTSAAKKKFIDAGNIYGDIIATQEPKGLSYQRNYALDMLEDGEWALFMVDDLIKVTMLGSYFEQTETDLKIDYGNQAKFRDDFKTECAPEVFLKICEDTIQHAEERGFAFCGFSLTSNDAWRGKKFKYWGLADGRCWLVKKTDIRQDTNVHCIEDYCFTSKNLKKYGGLVINNWALADCERYSEGSYGSIEKRMPQKIRECAYLVTTYPEFIAYADKVGFPTNGHIRIRPRRSYDPNQVKLF